MSSRRWCGGESAELVEPGEGALDDPALTAEAGAVLGLATGDDRLDAASQTRRRYLSWS